MHGIQRWGWTIAALWALASGPSQAGTQSTATSTLTLSSSAITAAQNSGSIRVSVRRTGSSTGTVGITYKTINGSAVAGSQYNGVSGSIIWGNGDTSSKTITVGLKAAPAFTGNKTFSIALSSPRGTATIGSPSTTTVTITGSGTTSASTVALAAASYSINQSAGTVKITVNRSGSATAAASVKYATTNGSAIAGTNYSAASGTLSWAANDATSKSVSVPVSATAFTGTKTFTMTLSGASGATLGTPAAATVSIAGTSTNTSTTPSSGLSIKVSGNHFVNGSGQTVQLRGVNVSGLEFAYMQHQSSSNPWANATGTATPNWTLIHDTWKANAVRIPLNEDSWFGNTCTVGSNASWDADPGNNYKSVVIQSVKDATSAGLYVIIDLHWNAPGAYCGNQQNAMGTTKSVTWWKDVATTFKSYPNVLFELFNEPFVEESSFGGSNDGASAWAGLQNGLHLTRFSNTGYGDTAYGWDTVGMQDLIDAVRATGATNVVLAGGLDWTQNLSQWLTYRPTDTLNQLGAVWHAYGYKAYEGHADQKSTVAAIVTAGFPVVITEYGDSNTSTSSPFASDLLPWADGKGVSYMAWTFNPWGATASYVLIKDAAGTPTQGFGNYVKTHYVCRDAGTATCP